jgi:glycosyltransferase involved in cell wall biosynthesis
MLVSVIIPIYGVEKYIAQCAHSLLSQTWKEIEYIFVNDGTKDKSMEVLADVIAQYPERKTLIINKENAGLPQARLSGLQQAQGEYVLHIDSDDWVETDMVEKMANAAIANDADMVYCYAVNEFGKGRRRLSVDGRYDNCQDYARDMLKFKAHGYLWNKLIRRSLFQEDFFYPTLGMHEDMVLLAQVLGHNGPCVRIKEALYHYRRDNVNSISKQKKTERDVDSARNFLQLYAFWKDRKAIPFADSLPYIFLRCGWIASRFHDALLEEFPFLREQLLRLPDCGWAPKRFFRLQHVKKWLRQRPFHSPRVLCCIFNYNDNQNAIAWSERLSPYFDTVILDSGSQPRCEHPTAVALDNIYYSGLTNEAHQRAKAGNYPWTVIITSDLKISAKNEKALRLRMEKISYATNVGLYQPGNSRKGRSHRQSKARIWPGMRRSNFQEGWFHMVRTDLLDEICPINLDINRLGWGIDMALSYYANAKGLLILVDNDVTIVHPGGTGYSNKEADRQMENWFRSLEGFQDPFHMKKNVGPIRY